MKKRMITKIFALSFILTLSMSTFAYAKGEDGATLTENTAGHRHPRMGFFSPDIMKELKISEDELKEGMKSSKSIFDLAKAKGFSEDKVKAIILKERTTKINEVVTSGKLTKAEGDAKIAAFKAKLEKWDGKLKMKKGMGPNFMIGKYLGLTPQDMEEAKKSGKTIYDLAKEKKNMSPAEVKNYIIDQTSVKINDAVSKGKFTKEKGDEIINNVKTKINNWDGKIN
ncbi:MAG TPA: hypothetical protein VIK72_13865 [Clostridiaceae bacterium]